MTDLTKPAAEAPGVNEFLGTKPVPRWRRWMKFWLPALILIVLALVTTFNMTVFAWERRMLKRRGL